MSLEYPIQTRAIDPYESYNSNIVNRLTRLITRGENCLHGTHAIDVYLDSTSANTVIIKPGQAFKDDVIISIDQEMVVDVTHQDYYINHMNPWNEAGYYWLCLEYTYQKAKPAPQAKIRILKPTQHHLFEDSGAFLFLKALEVSFNGTTFELGNIYDHDPSVPEMRRVYAQIIAGVEDSIPTFDQERDEARLIYVRDQDELYFGTSERWESFNAIRANVNTTLCSVGQIGYLDIDGKIHPAIATDNNTMADCGVIQIGEATNGDGKVRLYGVLNNVPIESGRSIEEGENVYLSAVTPGAVTDLMPAAHPQFIGTCISSGSSTTTCDIWFLPTRAAGVGGGGGGQPWQDLYQDLLLASVFTNLHADNFSNLDYVDTTATTSTLITYDFRMEGVPGEVFVSKDLAEIGWTSPITSCQLTAEYDGDITWYVNNSLTDEDAWEIVELNKYHFFSEVVLEINPASASGTFEIGERVLSSVTLKDGILNADSNNKLYLTLVTKESVNYQVGETLTGFNSGATGIITSITSRSLNHNLRMKAVFGGASGGNIYDYGIIYNEDEDLLNEARHHENNIHTLYLDIYTTPHEDDDGNPNLSVPLETQITNLAATVASSNNTLNNDLDTTYADIYTSPHRDGDGVANLTVPLETQISVLDARVTALDATSSSSTQILDNDIDTLFADTYTSPSRDGDGNPNLTIPLEKQIVIRRLEQYGINTLVEGSPTPSVRAYDGTYSYRGKVWFVGGTTTYTITNFLNGGTGQELVLIFDTMSPIVTIQNNSNIKLQGGVDFIGTRYDTITLIYTGSVWVEQSRSLNS